MSLIYRALSQSFNIIVLTFRYHFILRSLSFHLKKEVYVSKLIIRSGEIKSLDKQKEIASHKQAACKKTC